MADQEAQVMRCPEDDGPGSFTLRDGVSALLHDFLTLAELQWQLATEDAARWARKSLGAGLLAAAGAVGALSTLPVIMIGIAHLLVDTGLSLAWALIVTGTVVAMLGLACLYAGWRWLARSLSDFDRSRVEFRENIAWLKHSLKSDTRRTARSRSIR